MYKNVNMNMINKNNVFYQTFVNLTAASRNVFEKYRHQNKYVLFTITEQSDITFQELFEETHFKETHR